MRASTILLPFCCGLLVLLTSACPRSLPKPAPKAASPAPSVPKKKKKKNIDIAQHTIVGLEKTLGNYPCSKHRCAESYRTFPVRHQEYQRNITRKNVWHWIRSHRKKKPPPAQGLNNKDLEREIIDRMNIQFLLDDVQMPRKAKIYHRQKNAGLREEIIEIVDPHVGRFGVLLIFPKNAKPKSAVLALHGHGDTPELMADNYMGRQLAQDGFLVVIPRIRAHDCYREGSPENTVAIDLWAHGFSLMGLHVYEALIVQHLVNHRDDLDIEKWGLLGHSGGSSLANILPRLSNYSFHAKAIDYYVDFNNYCGPKNIHCETFGPLFDISKDINNEKTSSTPFLSVPYHYKNYKPKILQFFKKHLS